ncbi:unnamed protein product [Effrenium voratum]|nr:unnamed protein product [Effrenium voratum]
MAVMPIELAVQESPHLVTDASFVLVEGDVINGMFRVCQLHALSAIPRQVSIEKDQLPREVLTASLTDEQLKMLEVQEQVKEGMYVVLSEVHLDSVQILDMLEILFQGYEAAGPPAGYIFMGNFSSRAFVPTAAGVQAYREGFDRLKFMMRSLEAHVAKGTRFVFIPGPMDPGPQTLPKPALPDYLTADLAKSIPGAAAAPARVGNDKVSFKPSNGLPNHAEAWLVGGCALPRAGPQAHKWLPLEWGIWRPRFCVVEQASSSLEADLIVFFYHKEPGLFPVSPLSMVLVDGLIHAQNIHDPCLVTLTYRCRPVAWIRLPQQHALQGLFAMLRSARSREWPDRQRLSEKETELAQREARLRERELALQEETREPSLAESSSEEEEPFG